MTPGGFGHVLAAQALYGVLQVAVDTGSSYHGARLAASNRLDDEGRGAITALRLVVGGAASAVLLVAGVLGGSSAFAAMAPFAGATLLFAVFPYWESFGRGNGRPLSSYVVLRGAAPAALAVGYAASGRSLPIPLAGATECVVIVTLAVGFRLRPVAALRRALSARRLPWRAVLNVAVPFAAGQATFAAGTVLLATTGLPAAAAAFGVATRLLTGVNQVASIVATSLFPWLARAEAPESTEVVRAVRIVLAAAAVATCVVFAVPDLVVRALLHHADEHAVATVLIAVSLSASTSYVLLLTTVLVARHHEADVVWVFVVGTAATVVGSVAVVAASPRGPSTWMAVVLWAGQLFVATWLAKRSLRLIHARRAIMEGAIGAFALAAAGVLAAAAPETRLPLALAAGAAALVLLARIGLDLRRNRLRAA
jgi:O-antigen/teichoic acid export membrane protein